MKRLFDIFIAVTALALLAPVMLLTAVLIRLTMGRPVLFRQERPGYQRRPFRLFKFRTMLPELDAAGQAMPDEQRLTRLGRFIRKTSIDELPGLFNVLNGEMSLVGPRPLLAQYVANCTELENRRFEVRPGITGWAQVNGRTRIDYPQRFALDVWYVDHRSFGLDLKILVLTFFHVVRCKDTAD